MKSLPLHACTPSISSAIINRSYSLLHFTALVALFYYRLSSFLSSKPKPSLPYLLVFASEMLLSIIWLFDQAYTFGIKIRCPKVYFSSLEDNYSGPLHSLEYEEEKEKIKGKYELFKERVIDDEPENEAGIRQAKMPLLVYVSREKRPSHSHHFKAGALNVLLRVSGIMTNSPYILVLDCDMYCNDPTSARQAMCFHLDPAISPSLAFVQFPQKFHNINKNDIYDGQLRKVFVIRWPGIDGLQGPVLSGTGFYMKREALYGNLSEKDVMRLKQSFGHSNDFIMSIHKIYQYSSIKNTESSSKLQQEAQFLSSCTYEKNTLWVEDYFTGFILHCKGKTSVFWNPSKPAFLGSSTTNLNDLLVQGTRWNSGLVEVTLSKFCPFIYGLSRMPLLQTMCYGYLALQPLYFLPLWCLATLPQLCLLNGIPIYPQVSSSWFMVFSFIFLASLLKHLEEILSTGASIQTLLNEQRVWMMKSVTAYTFGSLDAIMKCFGMREASFLPTNKVADDEQVALYQMGKLNFQASTTILTPIITLIILNMVSFIGGVARMFIVGSWNETFGQVFLSLYILMVNYPVIEGMLLRKDKGRVPTPVTLLSLVITIFLLCLGHMTLRW
ncbi:cellulose synthase-like protein [Populus alba x Populus x berolinensis]|nr:cellulose synthase-like protein [Populus alba x Populus x berolinensis]